MSTDTAFASAKYTAGQLNAMVKLLQKQGGEDGPDRFLRGEITVAEPPRRWREQDGVIYFSVTSDGATGEEWITRLEGKGFVLSKWAKDVLRSPKFAPTKGVTTEIAVLKGTLWDSDSARTTANIRAKAAEMKLGTPNAEVACLIREMFTDGELEAMGLWWIVAMHEPIEDSDGDPSLLSAGRDGGGRRLIAYWDRPGFRWCRGSGFAFAVSQVGPQN